MLKRAQILGLTYTNILLLSFLSLLVMLSEIIGVGVFLPIFKFMQMDGNVEYLIADSGVWKYIIEMLGFIGLELSLTVLLFISFIFIVSRSVLIYSRAVYSAFISQKISKNLRDYFFRSYIDAKSTYHDQVPVGNLVNAMTTELGNALYMAAAPISMVVSIVMVISYGVILAYLSWEMTIVSMFILLLIGLIPRVWIQKSKTIGRNLSDANTAMSEFLVGRLRSPRLVRLSGTEIAEKKEFYRLTEKQRKNSVDVSILQGKTDVSIEPLAIIVSMVFIYFAYSYFNISAEVIGLYLLIIVRLMPVTKQILIIIQKVQSKMGAFEIVQDRLKVMQAEKECDTGDISTQIYGDILFKDINYSYPDCDKSVLQNININIKQRSMVALVGSSGSGKSTLIDLLPRLRQPDFGEIKIGEHSINEYKLSNLRQSISYVPQEPQIFDGTVKNHILYGKSDASNEEILEAAKLAGADAFIEQLPEKYDTPLGEDAIRLSGGQRQRLDLARALVRKAPLLILDEPTSNLDAESEDAFCQVIARIRKQTDTTIIIVSHRLSSIVTADLIVVLSQGGIDAQGIHSDLLEQSGWYAKAWKMQSGTNEIK